MPVALPVGTTLLTTDPTTAVQCLTDGGVVGLPTETVYGLAADAENPRAVARIYAMKGRPADHPVIVHVLGPSALDPAAGWASDVPDYARRLADRLWPGPLTLVLQRGARAGRWVSGGLASVGLRAPAHPLAERVMVSFAELTGRRHPGLAAPSANRFGRVSPTQALDVLSELGDRLIPGLDCVLDGGSAEVGIESTIVDCTGHAPVVLRPGSVGADRIEEVGRIRPSAAGHRPKRAPGSLAAHYAPRAEVLLAETPDDVALLPARFTGGGTGLLAEARVPTPAGVVRLSQPRDAPEFARALYAGLRDADAFGLDRVMVLPPDDAGHHGLVEAIQDRLRRAATGSAR